MLLDICAIFLRDRKQNNEKISSTVSSSQIPQAYRANKDCSIFRKIIIKIIWMEG